MPTAISRPFEETPIQHLADDHAINEGRKRLRKSKGAAEESIEEQEEATKATTHRAADDWREIPLEALERKELREALRTAVAELPGIYRQVLP